MRTFLIGLARDERYVEEKNKELKVLGKPFLIVCGRRLNNPNVVYRKPRGKYDAINFAYKLIPEDTDIVALNDVDTKIRNFEAAMRLFQSRGVALVFAGVHVKEGPQKLFYRILDSIRQRLLIAASGELMLMRYDLFKKIVPIISCKAEDSYLLFKTLELKRKCVFSEECFVETERTRTAEEEEAYKRRTVGGIYQALAHTRPPYAIRFFYALLPFFAPLLLLSGRRGYFWMKGILYGLVDHLRGDASGVWLPSYKESGKRE